MTAGMANGGCVEGGLWWDRGGAPGLGLSWPGACDRRLMMQRSCRWQVGGKNPFNGVWESSSVIVEKPECVGLLWLWCRWVGRLHARMWFPGCIFVYLQSCGSVPQLEVLVSS